MVCCNVKLFKFVHDKLLKMKPIIFASGLLLLILGCRLAKDPTPQPSSSIKESQEYNVFLNEYQPQFPYLNIEGKEFKIREAWVEHPHLKRNDGHFPLKKDYDFVMTFDHRLDDSTDFKMYTKDLTSGNWEIWFFLLEKDYVKDTLTLYFKEKLNSKEQKKFLLFKKK